MKVPGKCLDSIWHLTLVMVLFLKTPQSVQTQMGPSLVTNMSKSSGDLKSKLSPPKINRVVNLILYIFVPGINKY